MDPVTPNEVQYALLSWGTRWPWPGRPHLERPQEQGLQTRPLQLLQPLDDAVEEPGSSQGLDNCPHP